MLLGPDNKIYVSGSYGDNYSQTLDSSNQYLSVINAPDSLGLACNFVPYQGWLGGRRSFLGLPNIPNYSLGRLDGSVCDSLGHVGVGNLQQEEVNFKVYPNPTREKLVVNLNGLHATGLQVTMTSITGTPVCRNYLPARQKLCEIDVSKLPSGIYFISLQTNKGKLYRKFIKE